MLNSKRPVLLWIAIVFITLIPFPLESQLSTLQHDNRINWLTLNTEHLQITFPEEYQELATRVAILCEQAYLPVCQSVNYYPKVTQVVLHTRADFPGGVTASIPWRMELFISEPLSNHSRSGADWLSSLITHEFTHIAQLQKRRGLTAITYPFLGENNVIWQRMVPTWFTEGFATYNETRFTDGGSGRSPFHWMQMVASIQIDAGWTLAATNYPSRKRMPSTRMPYLSGYFMSRYLIQEYGESIAENIMDRYSAFPLLGFDHAVKSETGQSLETIYQNMLAEFYDSSSDSGGNHPVSEFFWHQTNSLEDQHSPRWIDDDHLLIYHKNYDELPELVVLDRNGGLDSKVNRILTKTDNSFSAGDQFIIWAELHSDYRFSATIYSDLKFFDTQTGKINSLTKNARIFSPDLSPDQKKIAAIQNTPMESRLVIVNRENHDINSILQIPGMSPMNPRWSPDGRQLAISVKDQTGNQDIIIVNTDSGDWRSVYPANSYQDNFPCWSADGRYIYYSSDRSGIFNIWVVQVDNGKSWMVTKSSLGAFSPDVSPNGNELAYKIYTGNGFRVASIPLDSTKWIPEAEISPMSNRFVFSDGFNAIGSDSDSNNVVKSITEYHPGRQLLQPQAWFPFLLQNQGLGLSVFTLSRDVLHDYELKSQLGLMFKDRQPYFDLDYTCKRVWPNLNIRLFSMLQNNSNGNSEEMSRHQGVELGASYPLTFENNVFKSAIRPVVRLKYINQTSLTIYNPSNRQDYAGIQVGLDAVRSTWTIRDIVPYKAYYISSFAEIAVPRFGSHHTGGEFTGQAGIFYPTLIPHHQLEFSGKYRYRGGSYSYPYFGALPIGYSDDFKPSQFRARAAYIFPIAYIEAPLYRLSLFFDYLDASLFTEWGLSWSGQAPAASAVQSGKRTIGIRITSVQYVLQRLKTRFGIQWYYPWEDHAWRYSMVLEIGT